MDLSDIYNQSLTSWSPDGRFLAGVNGFRLVIRDPQVLNIIHVFTCLDKIDSIQWALDSQHISCLIKKHSCVQAWDVSQPKWVCKTDEGAAGIVQSMWSPDSTHILTVSEFHVRVTVWSLIDRSCSYIRSPKPSARKNLVFSHNEKWLACIHRQDFKDSVSIFSVETTKRWENVYSFGLSQITDCDGVMWAPRDDSLLIWDNPMEYRFVVYSITGQLKYSLNPYSMALGIKSVVSSPRGVPHQLVALGSFDEKIRLFSQLTLTVLPPLTHGPSVDLSDRRILVYREEENPKCIFKYRLIGLDDLAKQSAQQTVKTTPVTSKIDTRDSRPLKSKRKTLVSNASTAETPPRAHSPKSRQLLLPSVRPMEFTEAVAVSGARTASVGSGRRSSITNTQVSSSGGGIPKIGIGLIEWSPDGRFVASRNDRQPRVVYIWDTTRCTLAVVLIHLSNVKHIMWDPMSTSKVRLAIATGESRIFLWTPSGGVVLSIPSKSVSFSALKLLWHSSGEMLAVAEKERMCVVFSGHSED
eukprot:GHVL01015842.1.p1 GENE.GHVL01015842.1~~GHVL01015842.1.p1  ORF type:complete len:526 (+),score=61.28 GHVL01015842.1:28-1605(+)